MATILIVDDLPDNRKFLVTLLRHQGHRLLEAADGREGLATARAARPDLVITDVLMPVMDGYELGRQLRLDPATTAIPVVFYTANYGEREARAFALSFGGGDVLTKPSEPGEVMKIVSRVLSGESERIAVPESPHVRANVDSEHLRLLTHALSDEPADLRAANARLRAVINIGLELASERDSGRLLQRVCVAARDLFGATYVTLGILNRHDGTVQRVVACGADPADWVKTGDPVPGILRTVTADRRTLRGDNHGGDPAGLQLPAGHPQVQGFLAAPVASPSHVHGWICLVGNEGRAFTEDDEQLVMALSGQVGRIYELEHEILERKDAESLARRERDRAQRYLDTAEVILLALDLNGRITLINRKGCDLLGRTEVELLGREWVETCIPERIRDAVRQKIHNVLGGEVSIVENAVLSMSGEERLIEWRNTTLHDDKGCVIGTFSSGMDITVRNHAVKALHTAEERMRFTLEAAGVGIWDMDYTTGVIQWSPILESQYGLQPGTFGGSFDALVERVHPQDREALLGTMATAKRSGADFSTQHRALWPDGTVRWLSGAGRIHLDEHGKPERGVGISLDVTERRTLEERYQQSQKMEAIGRLAGGVAHDFNNLLTVILGHCDLLLDDLPFDDPCQADVAEIQKAGVSGAGLTRQLLAFSRKQAIEPTVLDLNAVVVDMRTMLGRLIGEDVSVVLDLSPDLARVKADRGQFEQVVLNLGVNARDAMPAGGTLTIKTANVQVGQHFAAAHPPLTTGAHVVLMVTDTGTGMTPEVRARLFEPFFTTKELGKGTGLGLATVHGVVTASGGIVHVDSEIGRGTSFNVYFPTAAAAEIIPHAALSTAQPRSATHTVLVVDDAEGLCELARRPLQREGYPTLVAANADEALRVFEENPAIDVLLTDVVLPGASGPELSRQLVERRPALKVIYMSGYAEETIVQYGLLTPGVAFLHKPFTSETLVQKIHDVLER
jgi:PAS domain S-box-containing protein